jgi:hypothetical protein
MDSIKRNGEKILCGEFSDETPKVIANFSEALTEKAKEDFVIDFNFGKQMLKAFEDYGEISRLEEIAKFLKNMNGIYEEYSIAKIKNKRK